ncbi:MAG: magnesium chelatase ATPase subunit I [Burkholderiales bacterium]
MLDSFQQGGLPNGSAGSGSSGSGTLGASQRAAGPKSPRTEAAKAADQPTKSVPTRPARIVYPFSAIVGQDEMKRALAIAAVDSKLGGVLVFGDRGTGKSTAVRALAGLLPAMRSVCNCAYHCDPEDSNICPACAAKKATGRVKTEVVPVPVVDLPLGATEDRVVGSLDLERAITTGEKAFEPGILARANRGFLYIDEVNLLEDHLVDLLIDVAASGQNVVERDGLSVVHPARFVLVGSGNPEEGELRPQLLDRFGLSVEVTTPTDVPTRIEIVKRRDAFENDPVQFAENWRKADEAIRRRIVAARKRLMLIDVPDQVLEQVSALCAHLGTDGLRGELTLMRAARAWAAYLGDKTVGLKHVRELAPSALRHRLRRDPLDDMGSGSRVSRALGEVFGPVA